MTKKEIIQQVLDGAGLDFGDRTAARHLTNTFSTYVGQLFARDPNQYRFFTKQIHIDIKNRVARIPIPLIQNVSNGKGVPVISPDGVDCECETDGTEFIPMPSYALNSGADANMMSWVVFYTVTHDTIRFNRSMPKDMTSAIATVCPQFHAWGDNDEIPLPDGIGQMIIDSAIAAIKHDPAYQNLYKTHKP